MNDTRSATRVLNSHFKATKAIDGGDDAMSCPDQLTKAIKRAL